MRTLVGFFILAVLIVAAAFVAPAVIDWNSYRADLTRFVQTELGVSPVISGDLTVDLLPQPRLRAEQVNLHFGDDDNAIEVLRLAALSVRLDPAALLRGQLRFDRIDLDKPGLTLATKSSPQWSMLLQQLFSPAGETPPMLSALGFENGYVISLKEPDNAGESGTERPQPDLILDSLSGSLRRDTAGGVLRFEGNFNFQDMPVSLSGSAGGGRTKERAAVAVSGTVGKDLLSFQSNGFIEFATTFAGKMSLTLEAANTRRLAARLAAQGTPFAAKKLFSKEPLKASAELLLSATRVTVDRINAQVGQMRLTGALLADREMPYWNDWRGDLNINRVDLDRLETAVESPLSWRRQLADLMTGVSWQLPEVRAEVQMSVGILAWRGRLLRDLKLSVSNGAAGLQLSDATISLPGGSTLKTSAQFTGAPDNRRLTGDLVLTSTNFRSILDWLDLAPGSIPANRLRRLQTNLTFALTPQWIELRDWSFQLDGSRGNGGLTLLLQERPSFGLSIAADNVNLGHYFADPQALTTALFAAVGGDPQGEKNTDDWAAALASFDTNLDVQIESLSAWQENVRGISLGIGVKNGQMQINNAHIDDLAGASFVFDGQVEFVSQQLQLALNFDVDSRQPDRLAALLDLQSELLYKRLGAVILRGRATGRLSDLEIDAAIEGAGGRINLLLPVNMFEQRLSAPAELILEHPEISSVINLLIPEHPMGRQLLGPGQLSVQLDPVAVDRFAVAVEMQAFDAEITARGHMRPLNDPVTFNMALLFDHPDGAAFIRRLLPSHNLPGRDPQALSFEGQLIGDVTAATINRLQLDIGVSRLRGALTYQAAEARPRIDLDVIATNLQQWSWLPANADGETLVDNISLFDLSALNLFDGQFDIAFENLTMAAMDLKSGTISAALDTGVLDFQVRDIRFGKGDMNLSGRLANGPLPTVSLQGEASNVVIADLDLVGGFAARRGQGDLDFTLRSVGETWRDMFQNLSGSGSVSVTDVIVTGSDLTALASAVTAKQGSVAGFVTAAQKALKTGHTEFSKVKTKFAVNDGIIRSADIQMEGDAVIGRAAMAINLPAEEMDLKMRFRLRLPDNVPIFGLHLTGPIKRPRRTMDLDALRDYVSARRGS